MGTEINTPSATRAALHRRYQLAGSPREAPQSPPSRAGWGLFRGEPETCRRRTLPFLASMLQLGLLLAIFKRYQIEGRAFLNLATLALAALPVHYLAPFRWKKPLFLTVSIIGLFCVFGAEVAAIILGLATVLIGTCLLPVSWSARASAVAALAALFAWARSSSPVSGIPSTVWPILASIFMFRMMVYLYEIKHARAPEGWVDTVSYFFLLPNFCFMHFPVVDYRTLKRGYFADDVHSIQGRGLRMMFRGTVHLLCYRLVYHELVIPTAEVRTAGSLALYLITNYLLYMRVSGQFHMACGMLHLFGYQLPETHHRYLLATGFTDYWRRINIYWKDFMVRLFFNPVVFRLKRWPQPAALAVGTVAVFLATWTLHGYQSFWLRGTWGFSVPDALFWGVLGMLVMFNVQLDFRCGPDSSRREETATWQGAVLYATVRALKVAATFSTIALLWSLWSSPSLAAWIDLMRRGLLGT
jgi:hypothetical protein